MESVAIEFGVHAGEGCRVHCPVSHSDQLGLPLLPVVVLLKEVNDSDTIENLAIRAAIVLYEVLSPRL